MTFDFIQKAITFGLFRILFRSDLPHGTNVIELETSNLLVSLGPMKCCIAKIIYFRGSGSASFFLILAPRLQLHFQTYIALKMYSNTIVTYEICLNGCRN